jgi:hypothetical protein
MQHRFTILYLLLALPLVLAAMFSVASWVSAWGWPQPEYDKEGWEPTVLQGTLVQIALLIFVLHYLALVCFQWKGSRNDWISRIWLVGALAAVCDFAYRLGVPSAPYDPSVWIDVGVPAYVGAIALLAGLGPLACASSPLDPYRRLNRPEREAAP